MPKKRTIIILLIIMAVCLLIGGIAIFVTRSTMRQPTPQEIEACAPYTIDWQAVTGLEGSDQEIILGMCAFAEEKTIGENVYKTYTSDTLGSHLYQFQEMAEIAERDGTLYVQYYTPQGGMVMLAYDKDGMTEKGIYDLETDTYYYEYGDSCEVWTHFRNGLQMGF